MALPKLLQKLFANGGLGPKLNDEIIPDSVATDSEILEAADKALETVTNVGNTDIADVLSAVASVEARIDSHIRVVEKWSSGTNWYRKWSDGWIEQGGTLSASMSALTFHIPFIDTNYYITDFAMGHSGDMTPHAFINPSSKTTTGATLLVCQYDWAASTSNNMTHAWEAKGYYK